MARKPRTPKAEVAKVKLITIKTHYKFSCIYQIKNLVNGKIYIGSAFNFHKRIHTHKHHLKEKKHPNKHLQASYDKHGIENFKFEVIEECQKENLIEREQYWLDTLKPIFNVCKIAGNTSGRKLSNFSIEKMKNKLKGRKHTEEAKLKMSQSRKGKTHKKGYKLSDETRAKMSKAKLGIKLSEERKIKLSISKTGHKHSEETRKRMSEAAYKRYSNG